MPTQPATTQPAVGNGVTGMITADEVATYAGIIVVIVIIIAAAVLWRKGRKSKK